MKVIKLPFKVKKPILACGADMKGAFAFAEGEEAFLINGFGDLGDLDNFAKYGQVVKQYQKKLGIKPQVMACDLHPNYFSTKFAESFQAGRSRAHLSVPCKYTLCRVQHHEAHIASAIVDNNIEGDVIGVAFDGTGYGSDGNIWGGEFFVGGLNSFKRAAHLGYAFMPGGEKAIKEPWRMAVSYIYSAFGHRLPALAGRWRAKELAILKAMMDKNINSPLTSSAGRLFDAAGSLILAKGHVSKEAELPIELERLISRERCGSYKFKFRKSREGIIINTSEIVKWVVKDLAKKSDRSVISGKFHNTLADIILKVSLSLSEKFKLKQVVLSGGVFQNRYLTGRTVDALRRAGLKIYTHSNIATNDSGIPIGQIAIAKMRARCA